MEKLVKKIILKMEKIQQNNIQFFSKKYSKLKLIGKMYFWEILKSKAT